MIKGDTTGKRRRGRPNGHPFKAFNFHCDNDLHEWLNANRGDMPMTKFINQIIREKSGLPSMD